MKFRAILSTAIFLVCCLTIQQLAAQQDSSLSIDAVTYSYITDANGTISVALVNVTFKNVIPRNLVQRNSTGQLQLTSIAKIVFVDDSGAEKTVEENVHMTTDYVFAWRDLKTVAHSAPAPTEKKVRVLFTRTDTNGAQHMDTVEGKIVTNTNALSTFQDSVDAYKKAHPLDPAKSDSQKDIFASMNITVPSSNQDTQGTADLSFNHSFEQFDVASGRLFDQFIVGLEAKKSSQVKDDSRHFSTGFTFRKDLVIGNSAWRKVIKDAKDQSIAAAVRQQDIQNAQKSKVFLAAALIDAGLQFEGDLKGISIGNISNLLTNPTVRFTSPVWHTNSGLNAHFAIPTGVELGYNLKNGDLPATSRYGIARYMAGGDFTTFYKADSGNVPITRLEVSVQAVYRQLFTNESAFDSATKMAVSTQKGTTYYSQGDFKILFGDIGKMRPGFRISFKRGKLPPIYADTRAFDFGLVFETSDDTQSGKSK